METRIYVCGWVNVAPDEIQSTIQSALNAASIAYSCEVYPHGDEKCRVVLYSSDSNAFVVAEAVPGVVRIG